MREKFQGSFGAKNKVGRKKFLLGRATDWGKRITGARKKILGWGNF